MLPQLITEFAPAKVNLTLHVTGQRADGYHLLDSLVVFCGIGDWVSVRPAPSLGLTITGPKARGLAPDADNLVLRAARALAPDKPAALMLDKHLPTASGIGGGSADAAATLRALSKLWGIPAPDASAVLALGADVPICMGSATARMQGIGDQISPVQGLPRVHIVLVNPGVSVPTPLVFKALAQKQNAAMAPTLPIWADAEDLADWLLRQRNDLQAPACAIAPVINQVIADLAAQPGALIARMSGSGATCFALFQTEAAATAARKAIAAARPDWWVATGPVLQGDANPTGKGLGAGQ